MTNSTKAGAHTPTREEIEVVVAHWEKYAHDSIGIPSLYESGMKNAAIARMALSNLALAEALRQFAYLDRSVNSDLWLINKEMCEKARAALAAAQGGV